MASTKTTVTFWRQLNGQIAAQKDNEFFVCPAEATRMVENDKEMRKTIAQQFDTAPFKTKAFDLLGAVVIDRINV